MTPTTFKAIIADIEKHLDAGDGYHLNIRTKSGFIHYEKAWSQGPHGIICLELLDRPVTWLPIEAIESVELCG